jgi:hypothetical protein
MHTSSGETFETCGRLSKPLIIVMCAGSPHELKVAVDCYVMRSQQNLYDMLVGTPFINAVGGDISSFSSSFIYRPQLHVVGGDVAITNSIAICTYASAIDHVYKESAIFMAAAIGRAGGSSCVAAAAGAAAGLPPQCGGCCNL